MNSRDALRLMIRHYPGGRDAVAMRLGKSSSTLDKELSEASNFKLGEFDAIAISMMCIEVGSPHALAWFNAVATNCGFDLPAMQQRGGVGDLMQMVSSSVRETSDVTTAVIAAVSDGHLSINDRKAIQREVQEAMDSLQLLQRSVDATPDEVRKP